MKKITYVEPEMKLTMFENSDIITNSNDIVLPDDEF